MRHPRSRAERRSVRDAYISRRKFIRQHIWYKFDQVPHEGSPWYQQAPGWYTPFTEWGRYSKWNLNCTCRICQYRHWSKRETRKDLVYAALTVEENLRSWE